MSAAAGFAPVAHEGWYKVPRGEGAEWSVDELAFRFGPSAAVLWQSLHARITRLGAARYVPCDLRYYAALFHQRSDKGVRAALKVLVQGGVLEVDPGNPWHFRTLPENVKQSPILVSENEQGQGRPPARAMGHAEESRGNIIPPSQEPARELQFTKPEAQLPDVELQIPQEPLSASVTSNIAAPKNLRIEKGLRAEEKASGIAARSLTPSFLRMADAVIARGLPFDCESANDWATLANAVDGLVVSRFIKSIADRDLRGYGVGIIPSLVSDLFRGRAREVIAGNSAARRLHADGESEQPLMWAEEVNYRNYCEAQQRAGLVPISEDDWFRARAREAGIDPSASEAGGERGV